MTFIGLIEGTKGYIFMRSPSNVIFTTIQALFDKTLFPKCPNMHHLGYAPVGLPPDGLQGEHNRPLDDENGGNGDGLPPILVGPAGPVPWQHMQQPLQLPKQLQWPAYPPLPPSPSNSSRHSHSPLSYKNPSPWIPSQDLSPPRYQTVPPGPRVPSPWRDTYVPPVSKRLWQPEDDWSPYQR